MIALVEERLSAKADEESWTAVTPFDRDLTRAVSDAAGGGLPVLPSGAGHDAGVLALAGVPAAMLFVRNPTGVSHSPEEHAEESDALAGVAALEAVIRAAAT
jgi:N-carbamoyl-L-amino-acid hydrolase